MAVFKHHKHFPKERQAQAYLFPHICVDCRKSFKKPESLMPRACPQCAGPMTQLSRKFKAPAARAKAQWEKVRLLVENGFLFYSVYDRTSWGEVGVAYPKSVKEARKFIRGNLRQANPSRALKPLITPVQSI
jgi:hypothetical protein